MNEKELMAENKLLTEDEMLCCSLIGKYPFNSVRDIIYETCLHQDEKTLAKMLEVVEGAGLTDEEIWACLKDAETSQDISYYKAIAQVQLQAIIWAIKEE